MEKIVLISGSPRRKTLLNQMKIPFEVSPEEIDETLDSQISPEIQCAHLAEKKVQEGLRTHPDFRSRWLLGADTLVVYRNRMMGKAENREEAEEYLKSLSGKSHRVMTGLALYNKKKIITGISITEVCFKPMTLEEIKWYLDTREWKGAAGGYRIQEGGARFIDKIAGSYSNVMGLPISCFYGMLKDNYYSFE